MEPCSQPFVPRSAAPRYCAKDYKIIHRKGRRNLHTWVGFMEGAPVCVVCEKKIATKTCDTCTDNLCDGCALSTHIKGAASSLLAEPDPRHPLHA